MYRKEEKIKRELNNKVLSCINFSIFSCIAFNTTFTTKEKTCIPKVIPLPCIPICNLKRKKRKKKKKR